MARALIALGSNLGDRGEILRESLAHLAAESEIRPIAVSPWLETAPIGGPAGQPNFLNGAALVETTLAPEVLLQRMGQIENRLGRTRETRWGARTLDLDLLLFEQVICNTPALELPHPRMAVRRFVLEPAAAIAGSMRHPVIGWTVDRLFEHLRFAVPYVALIGLPAAGKTRLAIDGANAVGCDRLTFDSAAATGSDRSGSPLEVEIEFVRARGELLACSQWGVERPWLISDFWLEQSLAYGRTSLSTADQQALEEHVAAASNRVVSPKLLVHLETPAAHVESEDHGSLNRERDPAGQRQLELLAAELSRMVNQPGVGPVLRFATQDISAVASDLVASLHSMR
jgi:2-amino-4-hydroxy-6-hydroxymethyldihydropteridine diphosphokinase